MINKVLLKLYNLHIVKSLTLLLLCVYLIPLIVGLTYDFIFSSAPVPDITSKYPNLAIAVLAACILAPLAETFVFQYLIYEILKNKLKKKILCLSVISGLIFGAVHCYSVSYVIFAASIGICFQLWYILFARRYSNTVAFLAIAGIHALRNTISVIAFFSHSA